MPREYPLSSPRFAVLAAVLFVLSPASARAQHSDELAIAECPRFLDGAAVGFTGVAAELARLAEITGDAPRRSRVLLRHAATRVDGSFCPEPYGSAGELSIRLEPVRIDGVHNSGYDVDRNNGAMWSGRGWSSSLRFGVSAAWRGVELRLAPEAVHHANRPFDIRESRRPGLSEFAEPLYGGRIDLPQRFGNQAAWRVTPGQSSLSVSRWGFEAGASTENLWAGPAIRYPILLSNTAAGFPHAFFGTRDATRTPIGRIGARIIWGWTGESDYFDDDRSNDWSGLIGWGASIRPRGLDWLEVGALRTYHYRTNARFDLRIDPVVGFLTPSGTNRVGDELASLFMRAVLPESGAEFYAEWARTDRFQDIEGDLLPEPDHSQGYMLGVQKLTPLGAGALRLHAELVHLQEKAEERLGRPLNVFYTNGQLRQGHTHEGQLLGAWVGPGADAQFIAIEYLRHDGRLIGAFVERVRRNEATPAANRNPELFLFEHDVELIGGLRLAGTTGTTAFAASFAYHDRRNRLFFDEHATNLRAELELSWYP